MPLSAGDFLRACYWQARRTPRDLPHMLGVPLRAAATARRVRRLLRADAGRRPALAIVLLERIGDIVSAEPIARLARHRFPEARICWIAHPPYVSLPRCYPEVDHVVPVGCLTEWMLLEGRGLFGTVWNLHVNGFYCPRCCIPRAEPGARPTLDDYYEHGSLLQVQCLSAGLPVLDEAPRLTPPPEAAAAVDALGLPPRAIVVHGRSTEPQRQWETAKWRELVARLLAADPAAAVLEVGTEALAITADGPRRRSLCGRLTLLETAEVIRRAALFIGVDSGPAHLASAVGAPGVVLLGRYRTFARYMPFSGAQERGGRVTLLRAAGPVGALPVEEVLAAALARLHA